jgi:hypothetical protein
MKRMEATEISERTADKAEDEAAMETMEATKISERTADMVKIDGKSNATIIVSFLALIVAA